VRCPENQVIRVHSAYYGLQPYTNTDLCAKNPSNGPISCYNLNTTKEFIIERCENRNICQILINTNNFGDPCNDFANKQFFIQYQCMDQPMYNDMILAQCALNDEVSSNCPILTNTSIQFERLYCEGIDASITCPSDKVIKILCAWYGIDPYKRCADGFYLGAPTSCFSKKSLDLVYSQCNNQESCTFSGSFETNGFEKICKSYTNSLFIQWECVIRGQATTTTTISAALTSQTGSVDLPPCRSNAVIGACPSSLSFSSYVPQPLSNSTQTSFQYPILTQTVCQNSRMIIACPENMVIHVYSAYYGIQAQTTTTYCTPFPSGQPELPKACYFLNAFDTINSTCEYKSRCMLRATINSMSGVDLCPLFNKQLTVQYQCVDRYVLEQKINHCDLIKQAPSICPAVLSYSMQPVYEQVRCDGQIMTLECPSGKSIKVLCSFYGIHPSLNACNIQTLNYRPVCYFSSSSTVVNDACNNFQKCVLNNFSTLFTRDPCADLDKALLVQWTCL
jgi:hypothetical protein